MIIGHGVDIVSKARFLELYKKFSEKLLNRIFTSKEIELAPINFDNKIGFFAKRFAAKEAFSKALGTGIGESCSFQDIEVLKGNLGKPYIVLSDKIYQYLENNCEKAKLAIHVSISDEKEYIIASVILERNL